MCAPQKESHLIFCYTDNNCFMKKSLSLLLKNHIKSGNMSRLWSLLSQLTNRFPLSPNTTLILYTFTHPSTQPSIQHVLELIFIIIYLIAFSWTQCKSSVQPTVTIYMLKSTDHPKIHLKCTRKQHTKYFYRFSFGLSSECSASREEIKIF